MVKKANKSKKAIKKGGRRTGPEGKYHISSQAVSKSTGLDQKKAKDIATNLYKKNDNTNYCEVVIVTLDIRSSSIALVNLEDFEEYSQVITDYVCYVVKTCQSKAYPCQVDQEVSDENGW